RADRVDDLLGPAALAHDARPHVEVRLLRRVLLVVEVVEEPDDAPALDRLRVDLAEPARVGEHRLLDGAPMLAQRVGLGELEEQRPRGGGVFHRGRIGCPPLPAMRVPRSAAPAVNVRPMPDGGLVLESPVPLEPYAAHVGELLVAAAAAAPDRPFLAERDLDGSWRRISYCEVLRAARPLGQAFLGPGAAAARP